MRSLLFFFAFSAISTGIGPTQTAHQTIDDLVSSNLKVHGLQPSPPIDDATFLLRVHLCIVGRIPTIEEAESFHAKPSSEPRSELIDELLASDGHVSHFYHFWADILRMQDSGQSRNAFIHHQLWLKKALRESMPYDDFVYPLSRPEENRGKTALPVTTTAIGGWP